MPDSIPIAPGVDLGLGAGDEFMLALNVIGAINAYGGAPVFNNYAKTDYEQTSLEVQFSGSVNNLDYVVGFFRWEDEAQFRNHRIASFPWRLLIPPPTILIRKRHQSSVRRPGVLVTWRDRWSALHRRDQGHYLPVARL